MVDTNIHLFIQRLYRYNPIPCSCHQDSDLLGGDFDGVDNSIPLVKRYYVNLYVFKFYNSDDVFFKCTVKVCPSGSSACDIVSSKLEQGRVQQIYKTVLNPYLPNGLVHPLKLDESISNFRVSGVLLFSFIFILSLIEIHGIIQCRFWSGVLQSLIWVCTVCLCPKNGTLGLYGFKIAQIKLIYIVGLLTCHFVGFALLGLVWFFSLLTMYNEETHTRAHMHIHTQLDSRGKKKMHAKLSYQLAWIALREKCHVINYIFSSLKCQWLNMYGQIFTTRNSHFNRL